MDKHQEAQLGFSKPHHHKDLKPSQLYNIKDITTKRAFKKEKGKTPVKEITW